VYGPHDNFSLSDGHVIPGLLHRCLLAKRNGTPFVVAGSGAPRRQFMYALRHMRFQAHTTSSRARSLPAVVPISYAGDLARLVLEALRRYSSPTPLILAPDEADEVSIADVACAIGTSLRFGSAPTFDAAQPDGQLRKTACNGRLRATLLAEEGKGKEKGRFDFRFTPLAEGLAATAAWFEANYETARK
jgi:GDP-L-fucose synthase